MPTITLLGPQRLQPTLVDHVDRRGIDGPIAAVTAGWQERENEDGELREHLGREIRNLMLHQRSEQVFAEDRGLFLAHRARQDRLRELQRLYRYRLDFVLEPARELLRREDASDALLEAERADAIDAVRRLDTHHLARIRRVHARYEEEHRPLERPAVRRHRDEIRQILDGAAAVAIAGGHVAVLLNRMRLFGLGELIEGLPIFAWSAGAMALSERVVLFHDTPPQGMGNPEVLDLGLELFPDVVAFPHAVRRLRLEDPARVAILARRFAPAVCVTLDGEAALVWDGASYSDHDRLTGSGRVEPGPIAAGSAL